MLPSGRRRVSIVKAVPSGVAALSRLISAPACVSAAAGSSPLPSACMKIRSKSEK